MRRQLALIGKVLLALREYDQPWMPAFKLEQRVEVNSDPQILAYHVDLSEQAGFIVRRERDSVEWQLTWAGHEQIETSRR